MGVHDHLSHHVHDHDQGPVHLHHDPDDCDSYYMCDAAGVAVAMDCPEGLYFDITLSLCNWPENVDCIDDSPETLECMEGMTACLLSSEEDEEEGGADAVDLNDIRTNEN